MKTKVICLSIHKGGSGKSSISCNLAMALALQGKKVLVIDTDSQMNLSHSFNMYDGEKNFYNAFMDLGPLKNYIQETGYKNIDIVIGDTYLKTIDNKISTMICGDRRVGKLLDGIKSEEIYDFIIIDTNPTIAAFNISILMASDYVLIPVEPNAFGVEGLDIYLTYFDEVKEFNDHVSILGVVLNNVDKRKSLSKVCLKVIEDNFGKDLILKTKIGVDSNVENAQWYHKPLYAYDKGSKALRDYKKLALEVIERTEQDGD